jgi:hypothetical protein
MFNYSHGYNNWKLDSLLIVARLHCQRYIVQARIASNNNGRNLNYTTMKCRPLTPI